jgi:23S rRNA (adenine2503-C2)-methyltransferase
MEAQTIPHFFDLAPQEVEDSLLALDWPAYRGRQLLDWVYGKLIVDPMRMSNIPAPERRRLLQLFNFDPARIARQQTASDGTIKLLLAWPDGKTAECVMIPDGERRTACVSSQVGCPVGCRFCASGLNGLQANLAPGQVVEQVFALNLLLQQQQQRITNIVFMGMGEPLANYANVMKSVRILHDPLGCNLGARRITLSTVGVPSRIRELGGEGIPINLALSLHAPDERLRRELIPWAEHFGLEEVLAATQHYFVQTGREVTFEYILLAGVNDQEEHARQLLQLCKGLRVNVNLIRYNEVEGLPYGRPMGADVLRFQEILKRGGINAHIRKSRGRDIDAACGQLRRREEQARAQLLVRGTVAHG